MNAWVANASLSNFALGEKEHFLIIFPLCGRTTPLDDDMDDVGRYWLAVQRRVCVKCIDGDGHGSCRLSGEEVCGLKLHFPRIVETVLSVQSNSIEPYIEALGQNVCAECKHQSADGTCAFRSNLDCGLDRYFPLIVQAIEEERLAFDETADAFGD